MEHAFPSESFQRENRTTFSEVPFILACEQAHLIGKGGFAGSRLLLHRPCLSSEQATFIPEIFQWNEPKRVFHLHPKRNFRNFLVNGKRPVSLFIIWTGVFNTRRINTTTTSGSRVAYFSFETRMVVVTNDVTIPVFFCLYLCPVFVLKPAFQSLPCIRSRP